MRITVFGGSGFLGSHVADALTDLGHEILIFDIKPSPYARPSQQMIIGDILETASVDEAVRGSDYVFHFAGLADLDDAATKPLDTIRKNIMGTAVLLESSAKAGVRRFIYASTVYVYSNLGGFYRCSKQASELYIEEYQRRIGLDYTILRFGTLYGPRADSRNSIWRYLGQALSEGKIRYPGTGDEVREYIHVKDAARLSAEILSDDYRNQHIVVTGHHPMRANEMLSMIREILNNSITIECVPGTGVNHYSVTPYSFMPKMARKLVINPYMDMGQGLLECLHEMHSVSTGISPP